MSCADGARWARCTAPSPPTGWTRGLPVARGAPQTTMAVGVPCHACTRIISWQALSLGASLGRCVDRSHWELQPASNSALLLVAVMSLLVTRAALLAKAAL